jgi:hypothetical protein
MPLVRKLGIVATVVMTLTLAACIGSATVTTTSRPVRLDTSAKAITRLLAAALRASGGTFNAVYRMSEPLWSGRVVFVAERSAHGQFGSLFSRSPASAAEATSEFFYTGRGEYTCGRLRVSAPWQCSRPGPMGGSTLLSDYEPAFLYQDLSFAASQNPATDIASRTVARKRVPCLAFGSTVKACFPASGFIAYFSTSVAIDNGWTGTATLLSYQSGIPAHIFVLPAKPTPER